MLAQTRRAAKLVAHAILGRPSPPPAPSPYEGAALDLFYWKSPLGVNFGDYLSSVIVTKMACTKGYFLSEELSRPKRLLAVGSILHFAQDGDIIWGSGVNGKVAAEQHGFSDLDVRAVRGPLTRDYLERRGIKVPEIYGDPALLTAHLLPERFARPSTGRRSIAYVPNLHDRAYMKDWEGYISPLDRWDKVIRQIIAADFIVSSSLHGLVIADAFGIPCRYLRLSEVEAPFKYEDYVLGTGRTRLTFATSREEAQRMGPMEPPCFAPEPLMRAFPFDIWTDEIRSEE